MTNATEELQRLLDERDEDYVSDQHSVTWAYYTDPHTATESMDGTLIVTGLTPEQAIAATLGCDNRVAERLRGLAADMRGIGASSMTPHELFAYWAREVDKAADLAATLGYGVNPDGLPVGLTISEDGNLLDWRGVNYVRQSTLGGGKLTAEQVREAVMSADRWEKPMGNTGLTNTHLIIRDDGWQAIADELNATLGGGECELTYGETDEGVDSWFTQCGGRFNATFENGRMVHPKFCQLCGGKAVKR